MFAQWFKAAPADPQQSMDVMAVLAAKEAPLSRPGGLQNPRSSHTKNATVRSAIHLVTKTPKMQVLSTTGEGTQRVDDSRHLQ